MAGNGGVELIGSLQVALSFGVEQVVGFKEDGQTVFESFLTAEVEGEEVTLPFVRVEIRRDEYESCTGVGGCKLTVPTVVGILI